jgi:RimJ/RimL family protein N-acetyltransferase
MIDNKFRPWTKDDLESLFKNACNENIIKFMSDGFPSTKDKCKRFLEFATDKDSILYFAIDINSQAVGGIGISPGTDIKRKNAELGYWLSEDYWGQGLEIKQQTHK